MNAFPWEHAFLHLGFQCTGILPPKPHFFTCLKCSIWNIWGVYGNNCVYWRCCKIETVNMFLVKKFLINTGYWWCLSSLRASSLPCIIPSPFIPSTTNHILPNIFMISPPSSKLSYLNKPIGKILKWVFCA